MGIKTWAAQFDELTIKAFKRQAEQEKEKNEQGGTPSPDSNKKKVDQGGAKNGNDRGLRGL